MVKFLSFVLGKDKGFYDKTKCMILIIIYKK